jgi:hypothetical protein
MTINEFLNQHPDQCVTFGTDTGDVYFSEPGNYRPTQALIDWLAEDDAPEVLWCDVLDYDGNLIDSWDDVTDEVRGEVYDAFQAIREELEGLK